MSGQELGGGEFTLAVQIQVQSGTGIGQEVHIGAVTVASQPHQQIAVVGVDGKCQRFPIRAALTGIRKVCIRRFVHLWS